MAAAASFRKLVAYNQWADERIHDQHVGIQCATLRAR
jgi:hypothetical protein